MNMSLQSDSREELRYYELTLTVDLTKNTTFEPILQVLKRYL